jgi:hypothetical protein
MLLIRHAVLHPGGLRHVNLRAQQGSKAGRQWFHNFRQYRVLAGWSSLEREYPLQAEQ